MPGFDVSSSNFVSQEIELFIQLKGLRREPKTQSKFSRLQRSYSCFPNCTAHFVRVSSVCWDKSNCHQSMSHLARFPKFLCSTDALCLFSTCSCEQSPSRLNLLRLRRVTHKNSKGSCDFNFIIRKRMTKIWKLLLTTIFTGPDFHVCQSCNFRALLPRVLWRRTALCSLSVVAKHFIFTGCWEKYTVTCLILLLLLNN